MITPESDAESIQNSLKSSDTNSMINLLVQRTNQQRMKILNAYNKSYEKDLLVDIKKAYTGHFEDVCVALFTDPIDYDCQTLRTALKGIVKDEDTLIEILATRPSYMLKLLMERYRELFKGRDLMKDIETETSGIAKKIFTSILETNRNTNNTPDLEECQDLAKKLKNEGEKKWVEEDSIFGKIITEKSPLEFAYISRMFHKITGYNILQGINNELTGENKKFMSNIVYAILSPSEYFATRVNKAIKGLGTNDKLLIRILVTRYEIDMHLIKQYYSQIYDKNMIDDIKGDTSGDYCKILVKLAE